ncbi:MAG: hypothetical protein ACHRXM_36655 [Isosphaerales bacterium]
MNANSSVSTRRGYALMLVLVFLVLLLSVLGLAYRQIATVLRVEAYRSRQVVNDQGSLMAAAQGLALLENGLPPSAPYCVVVSVGTSLGPRSYTVVIASEGGNFWSVSAVPTATGP